MKEKDGRTVRGELIKGKVREKILSRYIDLLRAGAPFPTATQIANHAKLSRRVIFKHFADLGELRAIALERVLGNSRSFFSEPIADNLSVDQRLRLFIERQTAMLEDIAPFRRVADLVEQTDPLTGAVLKRARTATVKDIERALHPALGRLSAREKRDLLLGLHVICAWDAWETLRSHHGLRRSAARAVITRSALATLKTALCDERAAPRSAGFKTAVH